MDGPASIEYVPLSQLKLRADNPKAHDLAAIRASIERFGFVAPLILDEATGDLVAGHGRDEALRQMRDEGRDPPARVLQEDGEWLVPVVRGVAFASDREAEAYLVADNRLVELGGWEERALLEALERQDSLEGTGYGKDDVRDLLKRLDGSAWGGRDPDEVPPEPAEPVTKPGAWLIWDKRDGDRRNDFADCELAWCKGQGVARVFRHLWMGYARASERGEARQHPTQKPVAVMQWVIEERTQPKDVILDPYLGSGSTLIAAHHVDRMCLGMEIESRYVDVACRRWQRLTGQKPVLERTGEPHDFEAD